MIHPPRKPLGIAVIGAIAIAVIALICLSPPAATDAAEEAKKLDYANDIRPIFVASCAKCHLDGNRKGGMDLGSRDSLLKGGESELPAVVPHDPAKSRIIELITSDDPDIAMPQKGKRLSNEQIETIRKWIERGAPWGDAPGATPKYAAPVEPRRPVLPDGPQVNPIDRLLHVASNVVDDRVFIRRVYLDTIGLPPTAEQVDAFVNDPRIDKRDKIVNTLLDDKQKYAEHWLSFWNDALRNDYKGTGYIDGGRKQITLWLYNALYNNMPYDAFVRALINPTSENEGFINGIVWRGAVSASQGREVQAAQNVTQIFLGLNFKCNSCHDSFISDWKLADAYGLAGVFADKPMEMYRCEKPTGKTAPVKFLYPQLGTIDGDAPRATKMKQLAELMTSKQNGRLARTIVNRLWARFMGRGMIEPVDEMDQKPWNADLLDWLASDLADHSYDIKRTIALILTSRAYQLPSIGMREQIESDFVFKGPVVRRMSAEQFVDAVSQLTGQWHEAPASGEALMLPQFALPAKWIWTNASAREKAPVGSIELKKEFDLSEMPKEAIVAADADNSYALKVNGKQIVSGKDFNKPNIVKLTNLRVGKNVIEVIATNDAPSTAPSTEATTSPADKKSENPAGFWMLASLRMSDGKVIEIASDKSWSVRDKGGDEWKAAAEAGDATSKPWELAPKLAATKKRYTFRFDNVRACWANNDMLMTALGRPNRERVVTNRLSPATMLQMLELTNGQELSTIVEKGAKMWMGRGFASSEDLIRQIYCESLGRAPSEKEMALAVELVASPARQEGVEDLLWSVMMLPEFQLIY